MGHNKRPCKGKRASKRLIPKGDNGNGKKVKIRWKNGNRRGSQAPIPSQE